MEYAQGGSLSDVLRRYGALAERVVAVYTKQILRGLRYLHEHGMAHRDIKGASHCNSEPRAIHTHTAHVTHVSDGDVGAGGNILLAGDGAVKLADFGASKTIATPSSAAIRRMRANGSLALGTVSALSG